MGAIGFVAKMPFRDTQVFLAPVVFIELFIEARSGINK